LFSSGERDLIPKPGLEEPFEKICRQNAVRLHDTKCFDRCPITFSRAHISNADRYQLLKRPLPRDWECVNNRSAVAGWPQNGTLASRFLRRAHFAANFSELALDAAHSTIMICLSPC
jgi:hypothetical protein